MNSKPTPHKHAAIIKAWADGYKVQCKDHDDAIWQDIGPYPSWYNDVDYQVKPNPSKYKRYIQIYTDGSRGVNCLMDWERATLIPEKRPGFGGWIDTEWLSMPTNLKD